MEKCSIEFYEKDVRRKEKHIYLKLLCGLLSFPRAKLQTQSRKQRKRDKARNCKKSKENTDKPYKDIKQ
jgi:hypothetical protein